MQKEHTITNRLLSVLEGLENDIKDVTDDYTREQLETHLNDLKGIESDMTVEYTKVYQYTDSLFNKLQGMIQALEHVNGTLYSVDDLRELQGFVRAEWIKDLEQAEY